MRIDPNWGSPGRKRQAPKVSLDQLAEMLGQSVKVLSGRLARSATRPKPTTVGKRYYDKEEFLKWYKELQGETQNLGNCKSSQEKEHGTGA